MKTELKYISSISRQAWPKKCTHRQTRGVDIPCERDRDDGTTNKPLRYENKTYWNVPSASSSMLSLKMHTQTPGVDVRFKRYRGNTTMASRQTRRYDAFRYKREIFRRPCCPQKWACRHVGKTYAVNGTATTGTQTVRNDVEEER